MSIEIVIKKENDLNDPSIDTVFDLADCCRTCLQHDCSLTPTNSSDSDFIKFCDKLAACISELKWAKEGVPSFICELCTEKLRIAYDFQTVCLRSDQTLQLKREACEIQGSRNITPDLTTTPDLAECDKAIENVILNVKVEETQIQPLSQCVPVTLAAAQLEAMQMSDNPQKDSCQICGKELCEHIQRHTDKKHVQCSVIHTGDKLWPRCISSYTKSSQLSWHMRTYSRENFSCKLCDKKFTQPSSLCVHMKKHTGEKFCCKLCDKKFTQLSNLSTHMKKHTGEKLSCKLCDKKFTLSGSLNEHMKKHTGEKFSCKLCDKKFTQSSSLRVHMKKHYGEKFSCKLCDKKFTQLSALSTHMKKHTGEKFSCKLCDKKFTLSGSLSEHMKKHTGEFSCKFCDKKLTRSSSLRVHMKKHTGDVKPL